MIFETLLLNQLFLLLRIGFLQLTFYLANILFDLLSKHFFQVIPQKILLAKFFCNFLSGIILKDNNILLLPIPDFHRDSQQFIAFLMSYWF